MMDLSISSLHGHYRNGDLTPRELIDYVFAKAEGLHDYNIWINLLSKELIEQYLDDLKGESPDTLPLYGIPFAIKDNIDLAGIATTAACPAFSYIPEESAYAVNRLLAAGAIPIGKTNLDQFATGLNGTRSPYGPVKNSINPDYISGGSSSGSAVATALGLVSFALGTDTAGSGRVPAMLNKLIGMKPSRGLISTRGVVPACRSIDCVSYFTLNPDDTRTIFPIVTSFDNRDCYARQHEVKQSKIPATKSFGYIMPDVLGKHCTPEITGLMDNLRVDLEGMGYHAYAIDYEPFEEAARLLYEGPWVAERYISLKDILSSHPDDILEVTRKIVEKGVNYSSIDTFAAFYRLAELKRICDEQISGYDFILLPTAPDVYTINDMLNNPIELNNRLGTYTNFMNLLDYAAIAIPAAKLNCGIPFGATLFSRSFSDTSLIDIAGDILRKDRYTMGATDYTWQPITNNPSITSGQSLEHINLAVCGAHLSGMPLNYQLIDMGAYLLKETSTSSNYHLYKLPGGPPYRPGLVWVADGGYCIDIEIWSVPAARLGQFLANIPAPLGLGKIDTVEDGVVTGFICEPRAITGAQDISALRGWKQYMDSQQA